MNLRKKIYIIILFLFSIAPAFAQELKRGQFWELSDSLFYRYSQRGFGMHSVFKPLPPFMRSEYDTTRVTVSEKASLNITPIASLSGGGDLESTRFSTASFMGAALSFTSNKRWVAMLGYTAFLANTPRYLDGFISARDVLPGVGRLDSIGGVGTVAHYPFGFLGYQAGKHFYFEAGRGKQFWGDGYRSLIISDNAPAYPYLNARIDVWKVRFNVLYTQFSQGSEKKYSASHGISIDITKRLQLSAFEMVVWQARDSLNNRNFELHYLNPLIFYRPVEFAQGSADNVLLGGGFKYKATKRLQFYGQFVLDEFLLSELRNRTGWWANKFGGQVGYKWLSLEKGVFVQGEINTVRPFTYSHGSPLQSWGHMFQPIAHPLGANFAEFVQRFDLRLKKGYTVECVFVAYRQGLDSDINEDLQVDNLGGDIFRSYKAPFRDFGNKMFQGRRNDVFFSDITISKSITRRGLEVFVNHVYRKNFSAGLTNTDHLVLLGIRLSGLTKPNWIF
jgi:hypothetical protein